MQTRPELILLQKSMVIVEGVARSLDPALNLWSAAEPIAKEWMQQNLGAGGRLRDAGVGASSFGRMLADLPEFVTEARATATALSEMTRSGIRLDDATVRRLAREEARSARMTRLGIWIAALSLAALAGLQVADKLF